MYKESCSLHVMNCDMFMAMAKQEHKYALSMWLVVPTEEHVFTLSVRTLL